MYRTTGGRDIIEYRQAQQGFDIRIVRLWFEWVPKEDQHIDLPLGDFGSNLLVAADWTTQQFLDRQIQFSF